MKNTLIYIFLLLSSIAIGQVQDFGYQRSIEKPTNQWHSITLPTDVLGHLKSDFSDIRIFGVTTNSDTIETPYLIKTKTDKAVNRSVTFKQLNTTHNEKGYFYTFEVPITEAINEMNLDFKQSNFDWQIDLEGSQNQQEWFTIAENYRIISIQNQWTNYKFTKLVFPNTKYRYFRLLVKSKTDPKLATTSLNLNEITAGNYQNHVIKSIQTKEKKQQKQTEIILHFETPAVINSLDFTFKNTVDFYRNVSVEYLADSFKTDNGWRYNYNTLTSGIFTSIEKNELTFESTRLQQVRITIENNDNAPLKLENITAKGLVYQLVGRFSEPADYFLYYDNNSISQPNYDINRFTNKIPETLTDLKLGETVVLKKVSETETTAPLFENKLWLWAIMLLIIGLLGYASLKMLKKV